MLASEVIDRAQRILNDTTAVRWPAADLLDWLNDGVRTIVHFVPEANVVSEFVQLAQGTKQDLDALTTANALRLIDVTRNVTDGTGFPALRAVRQTSRRELDQVQPDWHSHPTNTLVQHYMFDSRNPDEFFIYPPQPAVSQGWVEVVFSARPTDLTLDSQQVPLDDTYVSALVDYLCYRAFSYDAEYGQNPDRINTHWQAFAGAASGKTQADTQVEPLPATPPTEVTSG